MGTVLITGATGGLGIEFAQLAANDGHQLILVGRNADKLTHLQSKLAQRFNVPINTITVDFKDLSAAQTIFDQVQSAGLTVDYLINNAGFGGQGTFMDRTGSQDINMLHVNAEAPTRLLKLFLPQFVKRNAGRVLNVASVAALVPGPMQAEYFATKAYLASLGNAISSELSDTQVTVTTLLPSVTETGFATAGNLTSTKLFAHGANASKVAKRGYRGMMKGKLNVFAGLQWWQRPLVRFLPILPKNLVMAVIKRQQTNQ